MAKRVWDELWPAKYRGRYPYTPDSGPQSDDRTLQRLGEMAATWALPNSTRESYRPMAERWLRHVVAGYLRDHGDRDWLDTKRHPLRTLPRDIASYGEPKLKPTLDETTGVHKLKPAEPVAPALSAAEVAAKLAGSGIGKIGTGGAR